MSDSIRRLVKRSIRCELEKSFLLFGTAGFFIIHKKILSGR